MKQSMLSEAMHTSSGPERLQPLELNKSIQILRALNHDLRQEILMLLHREGGMTVGQLYRELGRQQAFVSQQLAILRQAGFVRTERNGKQITYSIHYPRLQQVGQACRLITTIQS